MKQLIILLLTSFTFCLMTKAQGKIDLKATFEEAEEYFAEEDFKEALYSYTQLLNAGRNTPLINFKIGSCYLKIAGEEASAVPYLEAAVKKTSATCDEKNYGQLSAPPHAWFYLGDAYRYDGQLLKALEAYRKFMKTPHFAELYNQQIAEDAIKICEDAKLIYDQPIAIKSTLLDSVINNEFDNFNAVVSGNDSVLAYMTKLKFYTAVFLSHKQSNGNWGEPENMNEALASDGDLLVTGISFNGNELYMVRNKSSEPDEEPTSSDIYVSSYIEGNWTAAKALNKNINTSRDEIHASPNADGTKLYIASNRRGGEGGFDIWISTKLADGEWGEPVNAGKAVNSNKDETTPFVSTDGKKLYFSSKGWNNMGCYDIFYSRLSDNGQWGEVKNIGYPINSTGDDFFFFPLDNIKSGLISRKTDEGFGGRDIVRIDILQ
jgi:tetratricopeptide (TPR) repeat protein